MSAEDLSQAFIDAVVNLEESKALELTRIRLERGEDPLKILNDLRVAAEKVGEKYEKGEYFVADLVMAGEILKAISELVRPKLKESGRSREPLGKLVIGTVEGDIHDIGKNIVIALAEAAGFDVIDLGVDVPPQRFVEAVKEHNPDIVGMSGLLTLAIESMKRAVDQLKSAGLRDKVKVIIGGGRVDQHACEYVGADAWSNDAATGIKVMVNWMREKRGK